MPNMSILYIKVKPRGEKSGEVNHFLKIRLLKNH